ncbi:hypothetical protein [Pyrobaculum aerophilum]|nr:hypothetical protein [Pyrobaculum aerophilum]MCX8136259.1 hypothetical protein [Pyrobaculum aerophilum]
MAVSVSTCEPYVSRAVKQDSTLAIYAEYVSDLCEGAVRSGDVERFSKLDEWLEWLKWSSVVLNHHDYLEVAVRTLRLAPYLRPTDYGTARQRDLGQLWTDAIRGHLGEIAFAKWISEKFGIAIETGLSELGPLEEFLPSDVIKVNNRPPQLKVSIKTTKLRGVWLDIPYKQIDHSDIFILVRVGVAREHFIAFLKAISVIRDKILATALQQGIISEKESEEIWNLLPDFKPIPAYIVGYFDKRLYIDYIQSEDVIEVDGIIGTRNITVRKYLGYWHPEDNRVKESVLARLEQKYGTKISGYKIRFEGIGDFSKTKHFVVSSGFLKRTERDWRELLAQL